MNPFFIRLLSKPAAMSKVQGKMARRTAVYMTSQVDLSAVWTEQLAIAEEFRKKSI